MKTTLSNSEILGLTPEQEQQVRTQWNALQHPKEVIDLPLSPFGDCLKGFEVHPQVWHPAKVSARYHASYLFFNNVRLFEHKRVLDMGTGSGLMGIVMALYGATYTVLADISSPAVANAQANVQTYKLAEKTAVIHSDLFENIPPQTFDFIVFNQPFFTGSPEKGDTIAASMLDPGGLIDRFLEEAKRYLAPKGIVMMPSYTIAGDRNNPLVQGPQHGYQVQTTFRFQASQELQQGELLVHELTLR